jgi:hypothetical protein
MSLESWMVVLMESGTKTKSYKPVSQIACICVSFIGTKSTHSLVPEPFFQTYKYFCSLVSVSIMLIRLSFVNFNFLFPVIIDSLFCVKDTDESDDIRHHSDTFPKVTILG